MGRRKGGRRAAAAQAEEEEPQRGVRAAYTEAELEDEVDAVYEQRMRQLADDDDDDDDAGEHGDGGGARAVLALPGSDDDDDDGEFDEDEDEDAADVLGFDREDAELEGDRLAARWGKSRGQYYNTDFVDPDFQMDETEEEAARMEEEEALRLQRLQAEQLMADDFAPVLAGTLAKAAEAAAARKAAKARAAEAITVRKDVSAMSVEEQLQTLATSAPELLDLVQQFEGSFALLRNTVMPLEAVRLPPDDAHLVSLWRAVLPAYLLNIAFYLYLHTVGAPAPGAHPCMEGVVDLRKLLLRLEHKSKARLLALAARKDAIQTGDEEGEEEEEAAADEEEEEAADEEMEQDDHEAEVDQAPEPAPLRYVEQPLQPLPPPKKLRKRKRVRQQMNEEREIKRKEEA